MKTSITTVMVLLVAMSVVNAGVILVETGGTFGENNLAKATGAAAFAKDVIGGGAYPEHQIAHLNDGVYGNANSWIGNTQPSFAGIALAGSTTVSQIAWGRNNTISGPSDRSFGTYTVQYTTVANPNAATTDTDWTTIFSETYTVATPLYWYRHLWQFDSVTATGFRIQVGGDGTCIDEIELYSIPEPATLILLVMGGLGVLTRVARKRTA